MLWLPVIGYTWFLMALQVLSGGPERGHLPVVIVVGHVGVELHAHLAKAGHVVSDCGFPVPALGEVVEDEHEVLAVVGQPVKVVVVARVLVAARAVDVRHADQHVLEREPAEEGQSAHGQLVHELHVHRVELVELQLPDLRELHDGLHQAGRLVVTHVV